MGQGQSNGWCCWLEKEELVHKTGGKGHDRWHQGGRVKKKEEAAQQCNGSSCNRRKDDARAMEKESSLQLKKTIAIINKASLLDVRDHEGRRKRM